MDENHQSESQQPITLAIADDHPLTRAGIRDILEKAPDMLILGEAESGDEAKQLVAELRPAELENG
jgi:DNA-binding NarL/FixJ family response regulator